MTALKNCWYLAGWGHEFAKGALTPVMILGEPIVIYRGETGAAHALEDRCPHRHAPLSKGRIEGEDVRCMYHGIRFGPDGRCTELPGQEVIPKAVFARRYSAVEKHGGVWIWMGDAAAADAGLVPDFVGPDSDEWAVQAGSIDINADAQLLIDNLLDVSHASYVHERTFGRGVAHNVARMVEAELAATTTDLPRGVRVERWIFGRTGTPGIPEGQATDDFALNEVNAPGVFTLWTRSYPAGQDRAGGAPAQTPLLARFVGQIITPVRAGKCTLFYAAGPWRAHAHLREDFFATVTRAFHEDEDIIVAQQKIIDLGGARPMLTLRMDAPLKRYELVTRRLAGAEAAV
ncbi:MAG: Rieske 2Fe-2S domain-containing protein [Hyphomonadaceae bacterium]